MKMRCCFCLASLLLQTVLLFPANSRLLPPNNHGTNQQPGTRVITPSLEVSYTSKQELKEGSYKGINQIGSKPPNCGEKCDGCNPCIAIQVPTITAHLGIQFANYEPESWKCKCGPSVYSP